MAVNSFCQRLQKNLVKLLRFARNDYPEARAENRTLLGILRGISWGYLRATPGQQLLGGPLLALMLTPQTASKCSANSISANTC